VGQAALRLGAGGVLRGEPAIESPAGNRDDEADVLSAPRDLGDPLRRRRGGLADRDDEHAVAGIALRDLDAVPGLRARGEDQQRRGRERTDRESGAGADAARKSHRGRDGRRDDEDDQGDRPGSKAHSALRIRFGQPQRHANRIPQRWP
jgi:hypothetical protein